MAVVTLAQQGAGDMYLLLQRPKEGLLAGGDFIPLVTHFAMLASGVKLWTLRVGIEPSHRGAIPSMRALGFCSECACCTLAGLWEFPAVKVAADTDKAECRRAMDRLLEGPLGVPLAEEHVVSRQSLGDVVHIFSHIRLTMRAEYIVLQVRMSIHCVIQASGQPFAAPSSCSAQHGPHHPAWL